MTISLKDAASYMYDMAELWEFEHLDPDDDLAVIKTAFSSSHCDDFAHVLSELCAWRIKTATWIDPRRGPGHHTLVEAPDGRLLDVTGWVTQEELKKRYRCKSISLTEGQLSSTLSLTPDDVEIIEATIRQLPYAPFNEEAFINGLRPSAVSLAP